MPAKNTKAPATVASKQGPADENVFLFIPNLIGTLKKKKDSRPNCRHHYNSTYLGSRTGQMRRGWKRIADYVVEITITTNSMFERLFSCLSTNYYLYRLQDTAESSLLLVPYTSCPNTQRHVWSCTLFRVFWTPLMDKLPVTMTNVRIVRLLPSGGLPCPCVCNSYRQEGMCFYF